MIDKLQLGAIGLRIEIPIIDPKTKQPADLTGADEVRIYLKPKKGELKEVAGVIDTPEEDGIVYYLTEAGVLDTLGKWSGQARVIWPDGTDLPTEVEAVAFEVEDNLYEPD